MPADDSMLDWPAIRAAARLLEAGRLVALPTETVYGLGADAENPQAVADIYRAKGRPADHPLIVHVAPGADLSHWTAELPPEAHKLVAAFWPGPLTLILKRAAGVADAAAAGQGTIGLRCPSHPVAVALLREFKQGQGGVAAPSANRFGHVSPTTAAHVLEEFGADHPLLACVLEGGQSEVGIESTILDLSRLSTHGPVLLRPGRISSQELEAVLGRPVALPDLAAPKVSGSLESHYAPSTPLLLVASSELAATVQRLTDSGKRVALMYYGEQGASVHAAITVQADPAAYAHDLYADLRQLDHSGADLILVETPPATPGWEGVNDRLRRAAFDSTGLRAQLGLAG